MFLLTKDSISEKVLTELVDTKVGIKTVVFTSEHRSFTVFST